MSLLSFLEKIYSFSFPACESGLSI